VAEGRQHNMAPFASIVTPIDLPLHIEAVADNVDFISSVLESFATALVRSAASRIYIVTHEVEQIPSFLQNLSPMIASRMHVVDQDMKIRNGIWDMMAPVFDEADWLWKKEHGGASGDGPDHHEHAVCILDEFLIVLTLAQMYQAEADVNLALAHSSALRLRQRLESRDSIGVLGRIQGIITSYGLTGGVNVVEPKQPKVDTWAGSLLKELLEDARWLELSRARYRLGVRGNFKRAALAIRRRVKRLLEDPARRQWLRLGRQLVNAASQKLQLPVSIEAGHTSKCETFSPPLHSLDSLKPFCLATPRWFPLERRAAPQQGPPHDRPGPEPTHRCPPAGAGR